MKKLDEVLADLADHRHWVNKVMPHVLTKNGDVVFEFIEGGLSIIENDEIANRFLKTFYPKEYEEYF